MIPYEKSQEITIDDDGGLWHETASGPNKSSVRSNIGVYTNPNWVRVGCHRISRAAWESILRKVESCDERRRYAVLRANSEEKPEAKK